ncbi:MAG TPA: hypothetical protein VE173_09240, partial [Longimicrobiales bacterium]|nr:hypothetical protein [Longimicrobiales bacterium]
GIHELDAFVREGGTLVALSRASDFVVEALELPVENVVGELGSGEFFAGGSILEVRTDTTQPVMAGMPGRAAVFFDRSPVFTTGEGFEGRALAAWEEEGSPLLSGYLLGEEHLQRRAAALEVRHGRGRVVLLGFRPQWRGQPFGTFRILFNAALFTRAVAEAAPDNPDFWTAPEGADGGERSGGNGGGGGAGGG